MSNPETTAREVARYLAQHWHDLRNLEEIAEPIEKALVAARRETAFECAKYAAHCWTHLCQQATAESIAEGILQAFGAAPGAE